MRRRTRRTLLGFFLPLLLGWPTHAEAAPPPAKVERLICVLLHREFEPYAPGLAPEGRIPAAARAAEEVARAALGSMDLDERRLVWNRNCAGAPGRDNWATLYVARDTLILRVEDGMLRVLGEIGPDFVPRLRAALDAAPAVTTIGLASPGGNIAAAFDAAELIHARRLDTTLVGNCASACAFVFLGGRARTLPDGSWRLGFHQAAWPDGTAISFMNLIQLRMFAGVGARGVDAIEVMRWINGTPPDAMFYPDRAALCTAGIAPVPGCGLKGPGR
ncbi:hypothetical protein [Jannaschia marina]|uniref:hypothetical protein n=1 Tax=Jannaschia marina TaxID=2741674 RepID=UPI0015C87024|nr:hypothetical protein [Jannaschia marina]